MDGAKHNTDTLEVLWIKYFGKQAYLLHRRFCESKAGAMSNENPGNSRM